MRADYVSDGYCGSPKRCAGDPGLKLTLGGDDDDDDIRNWLIWLRREDPSPCKLCANCILRKFWLFPFFSWFVCVIRTRDMFVWLW